MGFNVVLFHTDHITHIISDIHTLTYVCRLMYYEYTRGEKLFIFKGNTDSKKSKPNKTKV